MRNRLYATNVKISKKLVLRKREENLSIIVTGFVDKVIGTNHRVYGPESDKIHTATNVSHVLKPNANAFLRTINTTHQRLGF